MPNSTLTAALQEAYAAAPDNVVLLHTLEIRHPSFAAPIRVVRDHEDLVAKLEATAPLNPNQNVTFTRFVFDFELPEVGDRPNPEIVIKIDNVDRSIVQNIELAMSNPQVIEITYRPYLSTDLTAPQMNPPLTMQVKSIEADVFSVTARCGFQDFANKKFPADEYTIKRFPGLAL